MNDTREMDFNALLAENTETIVTISDVQTHEMLYMNPAARRMYCLEGVEDYRGKCCYEVMHGRTAPCENCPMPKMSTEEPYRHEEHNEMSGHWLDHKDYLLKCAGRTLYVESAEDITARKEGGESRCTKVSMEDSLFRCLEILSEERDFNVALVEFLQTVAAHYRAERAYIFEFDLEHARMSNTYEWCAEGVSREIDNLQNVPLSVVWRWVKKFEQVGEFSISMLDADVQPDTDEYRILSAQGIQSLIAAPFVESGRVVGFLGVDNPRRQSNNLQMIRSVARFIRSEFVNRRLMAELEEMGYTDQMTGIGNRRKYIRVIERYQRQMPPSLGVIVVTINEMKKINAQFGTARGDEMIRHTVRMMKAAVRGEMFRIGGDEFAVLCENVTSETFHATVAKLRRSFGVYHDACRVAIGSAWVEGEVNPITLLGQAEELMYAEKNRYYNKVLKSGHRLTNKDSVEEILSEIEHDRFEAYFQPQIDLSTEQIVGAEALVRKIDESGTISYPDAFIPFYEMAGVIRYVDLRVLEMACSALREWTKTKKDFRISVNFSRVTLMEPEIVKEIERICEQYDVQPRQVVIEVTETVSKMESSHLRGLIAQLKARGFAVSLDDFGSSYSNLSILSEVEFDEVKIDKSLVRNVESSRKSRTVVRNSIRMCEELDGSTSVAEGIENDEQLRLLREYGCYIGQGYYFSKPIPKAQFSTLLEAEKGKCVSK